LEMLHSLGVVHRDVKPENIILRGSDAVLIDFDVSRLSKPEHTADTQVMGTAGYAAPEQYGFSQTDARTDIYAMGVLMNEMLIRQHPAKQLAEGSFLSVIEKCIEVNMDKRYRSAAELRTALEDCSVCKVERKSGKGKRVLIAAVMTGLLLLAVGTSGVWREVLGFTQDAFQVDEDSVPLDRDGAQVDETPSPSGTETSEQDGVSASQGEAEAYTTTFQYDLDGDGTEEEYLFGAVYFRGEMEPRMFDEDVRLPANKGYINSHYVAPCVWQEGGDGRYAPVEEFAPLLEDGNITLLRLEGDEEPLITQESDPLDGIWPNAIWVRYTQDGTWWYEITAKLAGQDLSAAAITKTRRVEQ